WYTKQGLPGYVITDPGSQEVIVNNRTFNQIRFTIHNLEPVEGFILVRGIESDKLRSKDWATYITYLDGNQSKEIGMLFDGPQVQLEVHTFLSQNIPTRIVFIFISQKKESNKLFEGERIVHEQYIYEKPGEIIVDNEDAGFQIIKEQPKWQLLQSLIQPDDSRIDYPRSFRGYDLSPHETWSYLYSTGRSFFGLYANTSYIISGGNGQNKVQWTAQLPESGEYDLFYYTFYFNIQEIFPPSYMEKRYPHLKDATAVVQYNFLVYHDTGTDRITRKISDYYHEYNNPVEVHLGTYYFSKGSWRLS
ncbi:hypothetical protein ACFL1R_07150, partial [Candidatus Latescibacterota bacterium]